MEKGDFLKNTSVHIIPELHCKKKCMILNFISFLRVEERKSQQEIYLSFNLLKILIFQAGIS